MKDNLRVTRFRDGSMIPLDTSSGVINGGGDYIIWGYVCWSLLENAARCIYNHD